METSSGHADLATLPALPHLYALGPLEGVRGDVTVLDGCPHIARVVAGHMMESGPVTSRSWISRPGGLWPFHGRTIMVDCLSLPARFRGHSARRG